MQGYPASIITIYGAPKSIIGFPLPTYSYLPSHGSEITSLYLFLKSTV